MINLRLANILSDIAEVNKSRTDDRNISLHLTIAARTIRDNPERVDKIFVEGRLKDLVGIKGLPYDLIKEYLETGSIRLYEEIKQQYSQDLIRLMRISGFGKKMLFKTYDALNIKTLEDLKNSLSRIKDIEKVMVVGSLRRKKSEVKDIDLLILPYFNGLTYDFTKSEKLLDEINSLDFVKSLIKKDIRQENISGRFETVFGIGIELIISSSKNWVLDMLYTTGSKKHMEKLEAVARDRGLFTDGRIDINAISECKPGEIVNYPDTSS